MTETKIHDFRSPMVIALVITAILVILILIMCGCGFLHRARTYPDKTNRPKLHLAESKSWEMEIKPANDLLEPPKGLEPQILEINDVMQFHMKPVSRIEQPVILEGQRMTRDGYMDDISEDENIDPLLNGDNC